MSSSKIRGKNKFQENWLCKEEYKFWLQRKSDHVVSCKLCKKDISVDNMGESAIKSHKATVKHTRLEKDCKESRDNLTLLHFLPKRAVVDVASPTSSSKVSSSGDLSDLAIPVAVSPAEIKWALKSVMSHFSLRSCLEMNSLFKGMFPDSEIANKFQMSKTKMGYYITFGIAPYFKSLLLSDIQNSPFFSVMFDESLNRVFQEEQMDIQIRYWDETSNVACTRYFDSQFMYRPNANNLFDALTNGLKDFDMNRMIHLSMDGPSTNWLVLKLFQKDRQEKERALLVNLQSCSLHVVSGALQTGISSTNWDLEKVFLIFNEEF